MRFLYFVLAVQVTAQAFRMLQDDEICVTGFIMDRLCIDLGTMIDNPTLETLRFPEEHSIHCLVDIPRCVESGYEVLVPGDGDLYERAVKLDSFGNQEVLKLARDAGDMSCSTCKGSGMKRKGFSATVKGILREGTPPLLETTAVASDEVSCDQLLASSPSTSLPKSPQPTVSNIFAPATPLDTDLVEATGTTTSAAVPLPSPDALPTTAPLNSPVDPPSSVPVTPVPVTIEPDSSSISTTDPSADLPTTLTTPDPPTAVQITPAPIVPVASASTPDLPTTAVPITVAPIVPVASATTSYPPTTAFDAGSFFDGLPDDEDGICHDDAEAVFFVERTGKEEPCRWLAARPSDQEELCRPSHPSRAFYICEETCQKCTDSCQDDVEFKFVIMDGDTERIRTCLWLFLRPGFQDEYCQRDDVKVACVETCQLCPTEVPTSAPCEDNPLGSFVTPDDGDQGCAYLSTITVAQRLPLCDPVSGVAREECAESCAACSDNCFDSRTETFEYQGEQKTCAWLSTNLQAQVDVCYAWNNAWEVCKESCNHWSCNLM